METDKFEPFRGQPLTRERDSEIRKYIAERLERGETWDTLGVTTGRRICSTRRARTMERKGRRRVVAHLFITNNDDGRRMLHACMDNNPCY